MLRSLSASNEFVSVYFANGQQFMLTTVLDVDAKQGTFIFDNSAVESTNRALLASDRCVFVAAPDGVKIQFSVRGVRKASYQGLTALESDFPADLIKLQRREYFRLDTPMGKPFKCKIPLAGGKVLELSLHDISLGGLGAWLPVGVDGLDVMDVFPGCKLDLGAFGLLEVKLEVRGKRTITQKNGTVQRLVGFQFIDLPRQYENVLQRFIAQLERERHQLLKK